MNEPLDLSIWDRSTTVRFFRWLFTWRTVRRILIVLAWTATLIALLYGVENWRGRHAWNTYRHELEARGEQLDLKALIPKPVPDGQNFAATPFIESWFDRRTFTDSDQRWGDNFSRISGRISNPKTRNDRGSRYLTDLVAWKMASDAIRLDLGTKQRFNSDKLDLESRAAAAPAVLEALKSTEAVFGELRAASRRPYSRYPVIYDLDNPWGILLPHLANIKGACLRLQLKACAELAAGQSESALADVHLMLRLLDSVKEETFLISYLVRVACLQIMIQPIWEGLAEHRWSEAQLQELQTQLQDHDFLADLKHSLDGERAAGLLTAELIYRQKYKLTDLLDQPGATPFGSTVANLFGRIAPHGWYYQEQLNYCRLFEQQSEGTFDASGKKVSPARVEANAHAMERIIAGGRLGKGFNAVIHHHVIASFLLPGLGKVPLKAATAQTVIDQAMLACALERSRLANGQFPDKPGVLVPRFISQLPNDVFTGEPYKYRRTEDGQFVLYSVGWDQNDDGGAPGRALFDEKHGDWVWQYPQK